VRSGNEQVTEWMLEPGGKRQQRERSGGWWWWYSVGQVRCAMFRCDRRASATPGVNYSLIT
jgi:hypothetical protein